MIFLQKWIFLNQINSLSDHFLITPISKSALSLSSIRKEVLDLDFLGATYNFLLFLLSDFMITK